MVFISLQSVMDASLFIVTKGVRNEDVRGAIHGGENCRKGAWLGWGYKERKKEEEVL